MHRIALLSLLFFPCVVSANPPTASYIFPAGGQRGTDVSVRVGGLFLYQNCGFELLGPGITGPSHLKRIPTLWFEGPILPLPDSQRQEDYPKDMGGQLRIDATTPVGIRFWRLRTAQGATPSMKFMVGDLPEVVEEEIEGDPVPVKVTLPVTVNGRIFPREDIDIWTFQANKGQTVRCAVQATVLGSPLDARLEVFDPHGRKIAESTDRQGIDPSLAFTAPASGEYQVRIQDAQAQGGQAYVYRLTLTSEPFIERTYPLGGRRGSTVNLELIGQNVPASLEVALPNDATAPWSHVFRVGEKRTNPLLLDVDDLPEFLAVNDRENAVTLPAVMNGRITKAGAVNNWKWQGRKGESWEFDMRATQLGSRLDGVLTIVDAAGKELARAEASPSDPILRFTVPADGTFVVRVQDRFHSRGGAEFSYRLRAAPPPAPDFRVTFVSDAVTLPRKGTAKLKIAVERLGGFKDPIQLEVKGLPEHVTVAASVVPANQSNVDLLFKADSDAKIDVARLTIVGTAKSGKGVIQHEARGQTAYGLPEFTHVLLAVALPTPFVIKGEYDMGFASCGGMHKRKFKVERNGYEGPIEVSLADKQARHLQGVSGPTMVVPAGESEFTYSAYLPPWMETGRTCRVCVMGVGVVKEPDGSEHQVSFSSVNQNEQLIAVVAPGKLAMDAPRTSFVAEPGKAFIVPVHIKRGQGVEGPVELELVVPAHVRGITALKTTIAPKQEQGELVVQCAGMLAGPFNMPLLLRATLRQAGEPMVAEVKLDVQP